MDEPAQRVIDPRRVKQGERPLVVVHEFAVRGLVADGGERGTGKVAGKLHGVGAAAGQFVAAFDHVRVGDLLIPDPDLDMRAVFRDERLEAARAGRRENPQAA